MFGALGRTAIGWAAGQLFLSVPAAILGPHILPTIESSVGKTSLLYSSINGSMTWMPFIITFAALLKLIAAGVSEGGGVR